MGRTLLMAEIINRDTIIATAHFESLDNPSIRKIQMEEAFNLIKHSGVRNTVIVGDFNFDSTWKQEEEILQNNEMKDVVKKFHDVKAYTMRKTR